MRPLSTLLAALAFAIPTSAHAQVIIDNLSTEVVNGHYIDAVSWVADCFQMNSGQSFTVESVTLSIQAAISGPVNVQIYSNGVGDKPGASLLSFNNQEVDTSGSDFTYTFTPQTALTLLPDTKYWVVAKSGNSGGEAFWLSRGSYSEPLASWVGSQQSADSGTSWSSTSFAPNLGMQVTGTAVPEPTAYAVFAGLGLIGFATLRRVIR